MRLQSNFNVRRVSIGSLMYSFETDCNLLRAVNGRTLEILIYI